MMGRDGILEGEEEDAMVTEGIYIHLFGVGLGEVRCGWKLQF